MTASPRFSTTLPREHHEILRAVATALTRHRDAADRIRAALAELDGGSDRMAPSVGERLARLTSRVEALEECAALRARPDLAMAEPGAAQPRPRSRRTVYAQPQQSLTVPQCSSDESPGPASVKT